MVQYYDLEKAVDYLIDETSEGKPFRDGTAFVVGDFVEIKVDRPHPLHGQAFEVIRTGRNDAGEATVSFRPENLNDPENLSSPDRRIQADLCRRSDQKYLDPRETRRRYALPLIVRECADGTRKARGQRRGSADWEDIPNTDFNGSEIAHYTSDLIATPDGVPKNRDNEVVIWRRVMFSIPGGADEGKAADTKGGPVGRRPAGQSQAKKAWKEFDKLAGTFTFIRGELTSVAGEIAREVGYKGNSVEKLIRPKYRELEETQKHTST